MGEAGREHRDELTQGFSCPVGQDFNWKFHIPDLMPAFSKFSFSCSVPEGTELVSGKGKITELAHLGSS